MVPDQYFSIKYEIIGTQLQNLLSKADDEYLKSQSIKYKVGPRKQK